MVDGGWWMVVHGCIGDDPPWHTTKQATPYCGIQVSYPDRPRALQANVGLPFRPCTVVHTVVLSVVPLYRRAGKEAKWALS